MHDERLNQLNEWLEHQLPPLFAAQGWGSVPPASLTAASSDASFRRYFRWQSDEHSLILMDAPPETEDCAPFVQVAGLLASARLNVPQVLAQDLDQGFLLLSDLGRHTYLDVMNADNADELFSDAISALLALQQLPVDQALPEYTEALLARELQLFVDWYVGRHLGFTLNSELRARWDRVCRLLLDNALEQPKVLVHRDFMPRNLMRSDPNPGVLDFQDAVCGPVTYDITCLFKDAFISWPESRVEGWLHYYWYRARELQIPVQADFQAFRRASDLMGVQRHLKVIGIFSRILHRDGKPRYLADVPRFFGYIREVLARRPELSDLQQLLDALPQLEEVSS